MGKNARKRSVLAWGILAGFALCLAVLMTGCGSGEGWTEVQSVVIQDKTLAAGQTFRLEPAAKGKDFIDDTGPTFKAKFNCTRLQGTEPVSYKAASYFESKVSGKGFKNQTSIVDQKVRTWPEGARLEAVMIGLPFFPWEVGSGKEGVVYFYLIDANDESVLSNIVRVGVKIKAGD
jgi:hypothetical protein